MAEQPTRAELLEALTNACATWQARRLTNPDAERIILDRIDRLLDDLNETRKVHADA